MLCRAAALTAQVLSSTNEPHCQWGRTMTHPGYFFVFFSFYSTNYKCDRTNLLVNIFQREIVVFGIARSGNLSGTVFITI